MQHFKQRHACSSHRLALPHMKDGEPACRDWTMQDGDRLLVSGSLPQLGNWQQNQPLMLSEVQTPYWEAEVRDRSTAGRGLQHACVRYSAMWDVSPG